MARITYKFHDIVVPQPNNPAKTVSKDVWLGPDTHTEGGMVGFTAPDAVIVSGVLVPIDSVVVVRGEGDAADTLQYITYGATPEINDKDLVLLAAGVEEITLEHNAPSPPSDSGAILLLSQVNKKMIGTRMVLLQRQGNDFQEIAQDGIVGNGGILVTDDNGNAVIACGSAANAVNYLQITNAATGNDVVIESKGADADIGISLNTQGNGVIDVLNTLVKNVTAGVDPSDAVNRTQLDTKIDTSLIGANNGVAGLDGSAKLLLVNFPSGNALQLLSRNAGNTGLEFIDPPITGLVSINGDITAAQIIAAGTGLGIVDAGDTHTLSIDSTVVTLVGTQVLENKTIDDANNIITGVFGITGLGVQTQVLNMNNFQINNVLPGTLPNDAVNFQQLQNATLGVDWKNNAQLATTGNITLSGEQTIDGVLTSTSRVLVKDQTSGAENGVYDTAAGAWTRTTDTDTGPEIEDMAIFIEEGDTNASNIYLLVTEGPITIDVTPLVYIQFAGATIIAGNGLVRTTNTIDAVGTTDRILVNADNIDIAPGYIGQTSITTLGTIITGVWNGTAIALANIANGTADQIIKTNAGGTALEFGLIGDANTDTFTTTKITTLLKSLLNTEIVYTDQANAFGDFAQTFKDDRLLIENPGEDATYQIVATAIAANRIILLPLLTSNDTFAMVSHAQTLVNKTLTAPKFVDLGFIADANGAEMLAFDTIASAVNYAQLANAATGLAPSLSALGDDANVDFRFIPKGTGTFYGNRETWAWPLTDEITLPTIGVKFTSEPAPYDMAIEDAIMGLTTAGTGAALFTVDVLKETGVNTNIFTTIFTTKPTTDASEFTSTTAATPPVLSVSTWEKGRRLQLSIDTVDTDGLGRGVKVELLVHATAK